MSIVAVAKMTVPPMAAESMAPKMVAICLPPNTLAVDIAVSTTEQPNRNPTESKDG